MVMSMHLGADDFIQKPFHFDVLIAKIQATLRRIVSREDLIRSLWDHEHFVSDNTLTVNVNRLRKKLEPLDLDGYIETKEKDEMLAWIHEVKTPLTALQLMIERMPADKLQGQMTREQDGHIILTIQDYGRGIEAHDLPRIFDKGFTSTQAKKIHKVYGNKLNKQEVLKGIDLGVSKGEFVGIMGPSGSGKTTLLNVLSSIDRVSQGTIDIEGQEFTGMKEKQLAEFRKHHLGFIFQDYNLLDTLTVKENVLLPLSITSIPKHEAHLKFEQIARELGIYELKDKYPSEISGGQKQRTSAARAFVHDPSIIFADEPTGALDSKSASDLLGKLSDMNTKHQATIIMVTHDPFAASYCSRVIFIRDGQIYTQLNKGDESRQSFFNDIIKTQGVLGGVQP
ncbi:hypothetical protein G195_001914 [Phytophthora kernoviae 00238/432]|uniref:ABC transporter domain-containing protein n=1 Tax=Phytophthora kernoviae 00238/432 TaxID=1284355 RepID=A0A8J4WPI1_9STRA|nr:hypothetical protein G195_001914 [Phytophthora kernoviae 00238/432]